MSVLPQRDELLVETFPRGNRFYMVAYPFEGRLAHQTLGMLLTRRLERAGARPLGFVATDYSLAVWALADMGAMFSSGKPVARRLFDEDMLGDDLDAWLAESWLLKRTFRNCAVDLGADREAPSRPGEERPAGDGLGRPDLRRAAHATSPTTSCCRRRAPTRPAGLLDVRRLAEMLSRIKGQIVHKDLDRISPLAVPIMLEIGREAVDGEASDMLLSEAAEDADRGGDWERHDGERGRRRDSAAGGRDRDRRRARVLRPPRRAVLPRSGPALRCPTCIWRRAHPTPGAACWCRPTTRRRRCERLPAVHRRSYRPRPVVSLGEASMTAGSARMPEPFRARPAGADGRPRLVLGRRQPRPRGAGGHRRRHSRDARRRPALVFRHEPSAAPRRARSPDTCIPARASSSAAARCAAAASPATACG